MKAYEFKAIAQGAGCWLIVKFYRSPTMGECHAGYLTIASTSEGEALRIGREALA